MGSTSSFEVIGVISKTSGGPLVEIVLIKVFANFFSRNGWRAMAGFGWKSK
jgi:hypothetical protein